MLIWFLNLLTEDALGQTKMGSLHQVYANRCFFHNDIPHRETGSWDHLKLLKGSPPPFQNRWFVCIMNDGVSFLRGVYTVSYRCPYELIFINGYADMWFSQCINVTPQFLSPLIWDIKCVGLFPSLHENSGILQIHNLCYRGNTLL